MKIPDCNYNNNSYLHVTRCKSHKSLQASNSNTKSHSRYIDYHINVSSNKTVQNYINQRLNEKKTLSSSLKLSNSKYHNERPIKCKQQSNTISCEQVYYYESSNNSFNTELLFLRAENLKLKNILETTKEEYISLYKQFENIKKDLLANNNSKKIPTKIDNKKNTISYSMNRNNKTDFNFTSTINSLTLSDDDEL